MKDWKKFDLSRAQRDMLVRYAAGEQPTKGKATIRGLVRRQWVRDGAITDYGREVLGRVPVGAKVVDHIEPARRVPNVHYAAPRLRDALLNTTGEKAESCEVCGQAQRATKQTGCSYLGDDEANGGAGLVQLRTAAA
jgi:hypothetical protein